MQCQMTTAVLVACLTMLLHAASPQVWGEDRVLVSEGDMFGGKTLPDLGGRLSINGPGDVVFSGSFSGGSGIFKLSSGSGQSLLVQSGEMNR